LLIVQRAGFIAEILCEICLSEWKNERRACAYFASAKNLTLCSVAILARLRLLCSLVRNYTEIEPKQSTCMRCRSLQMRYTQRVSVWPVGLAGYLRYESPVLDSRDARVIGWFTAWKPKREYAVDMAGFAVSTRLIVERRQAGFSYSVPRGEQETFFLQQLISGLSELEPRANNCTEVP
jgi:hypothetical protein